MADELENFRDPAKLKAFFQEQDEDIANEAGRITNALAQIDALQIALRAMLTALDTPLPAIRTMVMQALNEALDKAKRDTTASEDWTEARIEALATLATDIDHDTKLFPKG